FGSSYELAAHEGAQMARRHDVVQVSVNHRLNILGFFDMSEIGGSAYGESVNVGMTDLVASLRWVRDNIANFGGDPDKVMIYGQSGGGGNPPSAEQSRELSRQIMKDLGLAPNDLASLQKMDWA